MVISTAADFERIFQISSVSALLDLGKSTSSTLDEGTLRKTQRSGSTPQFRIEGCPPGKASSRVETPKKFTSCIGLILRALRSPFWTTSMQHFWSPLPNPRQLLLEGLILKDRTWRRKLGYPEHHRRRPGIPRDVCWLSLVWSLRSRTQPFHQSRSCSPRMHCVETRARRRSGHGGCGLLNSEFFLSHSISGCFVPSSEIFLRSFVATEFPPSP